jgi:hypothetical protein
MRITGLQQMTGPLEGCNRVEVIDGTGRAYVKWADGIQVSWSIQDDDKTLKVFIAEPNTVRGGSNKDGHAVGILRDDYPNLDAVIEGRVAGAVANWPGIRSELIRLFQRCHSQCNPQEAAK